MGIAIQPAFSSDTIELHSLVRLSRRVWLASETACSHPAPPNIFYSVPTESAPVWDTDLYAIGFRPSIIITLHDRNYVHAGSWPYLQSCPVVSISNLRNSTTLAQHGNTRDSTRHTAACIGQSGGHLLGIR